MVPYTDHMPIEKISGSTYEDMTGFEPEEGRLHFSVPGDLYHQWGRSRLECMISMVAKEPLEITSTYYHEQSGEVAISAEPREERLSMGQLVTAGLKVEVIMNSRGTPEVHIQSDQNRTDQNGAPLLFVELDGDSIYECQEPV